jgi:hypothetical protein
MRSVRYLLLVAVVGVSLSVVALPREGGRERERKERVNPVVEVVKRAVRALGDFLVTPTP